MYVLCGKLQRHVLYDKIRGQYVSYCMARLWTLCYILYDKVRSLFVSFVWQSKGILFIAFYAKVRR